MHHQLTPKQLSAKSDVTKIGRNRRFINQNSISFIIGTDDDEHHPLAAYSRP
jgi:hypothetical protein